MLFLLKKEGNIMKKFLMVIGGIVVAIVVIVIIIFIFVSMSSEKLVCKSKEGNITIMYNDKTITGYTSNGISYDLDGQKEYAEKIGIDTYIKEFSQYFSNNTTGSCK